MADAARARSILAHYPHGPMGAPVIWPQQPDLPVYHNRAMWPFVTAYGLRAAIVGRNVAVADAAYDSLMRGAALNLSNMENLEWLSGQPLLLDEAHPNLIGPVINSKRQLWSVGAYLGMVIRDVFGVSSTARTASPLQPFVTAPLRGGFVRGQRQMALRNLRLRGHASTSAAPARPRRRSEATAIRASSASCRRQAGRRRHPLGRAGPHSRIEVALGRLLPGDTAIRRVNADPYEEAPAVFGPREPRIAALARAGGATLTIGAPPAAGRRHVTLHRLPRRQAGRVRAVAPAPGPTAAARRRPATRSRRSITASGNRSHHSLPRCVDAAWRSPRPTRACTRACRWPPNARFAEPHLAGWGKPKTASPSTRCACRRPATTPCRCATTTAPTR